MQASMSSARWKWIGSRGGEIILVAALLVAVAVPAGADLVTLKGARTMRVVAVTRDGASTKLELLSGGTVMVPTASIESIEPEGVLPEICNASPYRCQDRVMLLSRRARALAASPEPASAPQTEAKSPQ
jgi:hypothetical protein